jgi:hypothetical protein
MLMAHHQLQPWRSSLLFSACMTALQQHKLLLLAFQSLLSCIHLLQVKTVGDIVTVVPDAGSTATVLVSDLSACKAYVQVIDTVLIPTAVSVSMILLLSVCLSICRSACLAVCV